MGFTEEIEKMTSDEEMDPKEYCRRRRSRDFWSVTELDIENVSMLSRVQSGLLGALQKISMSTISTYH